MALGEVLLRSTLITMAPNVFQKTNFKGYFSQSQTSKCLMRFFGSGTGPWAQISWEGTIFDVEHDHLKIFPIFENFGKSRNKIWVPPKSNKPVSYVDFFFPEFNLGMHNTVAKILFLDFNLWLAVGDFWRQRLTQKEVKIEVKYLLVLKIERYCEGFALNGETICRLFTGKVIEVFL